MRDKLDRIERAEAEILLDRFATDDDALRQFVYVAVALKADSDSRDLALIRAALQAAKKISVEHGHLCSKMGDMEKARTASTIADLIDALSPQTIFDQIRQEKM